MAFSLYPHFIGDPIEQAYKYVDTVLANAPDNGQFRLQDTINNSDLSKLDKDIARHISSSLRIVIRDYLKYVEPIHPNWKPLRLTDEGRKAKKAGGHNTYELLKEQSKISPLTNNLYGNNYGQVVQAGHQSSLSHLDLNSNSIIYPECTKSMRSETALKKGIANKILANPWIITIIGGLIIAFLAKYFGWV